MMRLAPWFVLIGAAMLLTVNTCALPLLDPDEARFARTSVEMLRAGDPVVPQFEGLHWCTGSSPRCFKRSA